MPPVDDATIANTLEEWSVTFVGPGSAELARIPAQWTPIVLDNDPNERWRSAVALWNQSLLDLVPRFAEALRTRFVDVRCAVTDDCPVLVYVAEGEPGTYVSWVGYDPRTFGEPPPFWDSFPRPLRDFLREVHAGFVSWSGMSFGPMRPRHMMTLAELAESPDGIDGWEPEVEIDSTRLVPLCNDGGVLYYCLSPDLEAGQVALVYEGDVDPQDFGAEFDEMLMSRFGS